MAPTRPAKTTPMDRTSGWTTPLAMADATWVLRIRKAMKLKAAAQTTASRGVRTRVATTVAIELAASWKPLVKSKARAMPMTATSARSFICSGPELNPGWSGARAEGGAVVQAAVSVGAAPDDHGVAGPDRGVEGAAPERAGGERLPGVGGRGVGARGGGRRPPPGPR